MMEKFEGECLCGESRYRVESGAESAMYLCHCSRCRKESGSAHGASIFVQGADLIWLRGGGDALKTFQLENTRKSRAFCKTCGTPLPRPEGETVVIPAGSLDSGEGELQPTAHIHWSSRAGWEDRLGALQVFTELPRP